MLLHGVLGRALRIAYRATECIGINVYLAGIYSIPRSHTRCYRGSLSSSIFFNGTRTIHDLEQCK